MLDVAIIGLDSAWETTYQPALQVLRDRMRIRVVWDAVATRAEQAASEFQAIPCAGIHRAVALPSVRAVLVLGDAWCHDALLSFLMQNDKPSFVADGTPLLRARAINDFTNKDVRTPMIVPELSLRYTPATSRLRELMATRLGAAREINVQVECPANSDLMQSRLPLIDWCRYLVGKQAVTQSATNETLQLEFPPSRSQSETALARITLVETSTVAQNVSQFTATIQCERGTAKLRGTQEITWTDTEDRRTEILEGERDGMVVLLDLFCRRVMGGLVPIPTIDDLITSANLAKEA
ncbi:hypothetical protein CA54_38070 [Symmachiella macrocystis]|uniref:Uncharacterized protein n=1 Tax=Symmachiella macrocystis TaxID=2527985 RepID=A0A5C6BT98_9PLAN|nr:hypothetical protein [Symmachiella macrocystis]TWU14937.1 hypothetical protein CA54_38070 [Symmachiella macrocystis]